MSKKKPARTKLQLWKRTADQITQACSGLWPNNNAACNQFVIAVAAQFGVVLNGLADNIVDEIQGAGWTALADGAAAGAAAAQGQLVVGAEKGATHVPPATEGHAVIVVSGPLALNEYPTAFWGSDDPNVRAMGDGTNTVNYAWNKNSRDLVTYAAHDVNAQLKRKVPR
jgi:hypothetical protein